MEIELFIYLLGALYTLGRYISESEKVWVSMRDIVPCVSAGVLIVVFWPVGLGYIGAIEK